MAIKKTPVIILVQLKQELDALGYGETKKRNSIFATYAEYGSPCSLLRKIRKQFGAKRAKRKDAGERDPDLRHAVELVVELKIKHLPKVVPTTVAVEQLFQEGKLTKKFKTDSINRIIKEENLIPEEHRRNNYSQKREHQKILKSIHEKHKDETIIKLNEELESATKLTEKTKKQLEKKVHTILKTSTKLKHENHRLLMENQLIKDIIDIHGNKYGLHTLLFNNINEPITVGCQKHGLVAVDIEYFKSYGCPVCHEIQLFKQQARDIYGDLFNYDLITSLDGKLSVYGKCHDGLFFSNKEDLLKGKGCTTCCTNKSNPRIGILEENAIAPIIKSINDNFEPQFPVSTIGGIFFIDFYFKDLKIAVEFDENYHKKQIEKDCIREEIIKEVLGCSFIRIPEGLIGNKEEIERLLVPLTKDIKCGEG
jgi:hypothetical protein